MIGRCLKVLCLKIIEKNKLAIMPIPPMAMC
jgi:hypothetical protein